MFVLVSDFLSTVLLTSTYCILHNDIIQMSLIMMHDEVKKAL